MIQLRRVILFAKDMDLMIGFYCRTLGLSLVPGTASPTWAELGAGGAALALHAIPAEVAKSITITSPPRAREETPIKLVFAVQDVEAERTRLVAAGVPMSEMRAWGACDGVDPEGNVFQITRA